MSVRDITISPDEELVVRARAKSDGAAAAQPAAAAAQPSISQASAPRIIKPKAANIPQEAIDRATAIASNFQTAISAAAKAATEKAAIQIEAGAVPAPFTFGWDVAVAGPYLLNGPNFPPSPVFQPNKVVPVGSFIAFFGYQYYDSPSTAWAFLSKPENIRFETLNLTTATPGPNGSIAYTNIAGITPLRVVEDVQFFVMPAPTVTLGNDAELYELHFTVDLDPVPGTDAAAFSQWYYDPDTTMAGPALPPPPLFVVSPTPASGPPAKTPGWNNGDLRFLVFNP